MIQDGNILYIEIQRGDKIITIGDDECENFIESLDGKQSHWWTNDDITDKEKFIQVFPDYHIFSLFLGMSPYSFIDILSSISTYEDLLLQLTNIISTPNEDICYDIYNITFVTRNSIIKSILYDTYDNDKKCTNLYSVGDIEYSAIQRINDKYQAEYSPFILDRNKTCEIIPEYNSIKRIMQHEYCIEDIQRCLIDIQSTEPINIIRRISSHIDIVSVISDVKEKVSLEDRGPLICIKSPESERCSENDGIPICIALISEKRWNSILNVVDQYKSNIEHDYSCGGHGCVLYYNIPDMIDNCQVIRGLSLDTISFIRQIEDVIFLSIVTKEIELLLD